MLKYCVQVLPPSVDRSSGALPVQPPKPAVMTMSLGLAGLIAMDGSELPPVLVFCRLGFVLLRKGSRRKTPGVKAPLLGASAETAGRLYRVVSGAELWTGSESARAVRLGSAGLTTACISALMATTSPMSALRRNV